MAEVTSLGADDVIGRSLYQLCHVNDVTTLRHAHVEGWYCTIAGHVGRVCDHSATNLLIVDSVVLWCRKKTLCGPIYGVH